MLTPSFFQDDWRGGYRKRSNKRGTDSGEPDRGVSDSGGSDSEESDSVESYSGGLRPTVSRMRFVEDS